MSGHSSHGPGHSEDFHFRPVLFLVPISMLLLVLYVVTVGLWSSSALTNEMNKKQAEGAEPMRTQLVSLRLHEDSVLTEYRWKDKENGVVQIPVARAMELMLQEAAHSADTVKTVLKTNQAAKQKKK